jgi:hypothetical protein
MSWRELASSFKVTTVESMLSLQSIQRCVRARLHWLDPPESPLGVVFALHRWASPEHPDPGALTQSVHAFFL